MDLNLWEMIKELTENPNKKFVNEYGKIVYADDMGFIMLENTTFSEKPTDLFRKNIKTKWREIETRKSVTWQEALEARINGKDVECYYDEETYIYEYDKQDSFNSLRDQENQPVSVEELKYGKWYILD